MKKQIAIVALIVLLSSTISTAAVLTGLMVWGYDGLARAKMWVSPDGRMSLANLLNNQPTAWDLWPTTGTKPKEHAISEVTVHRNGWWDSCVARLSLAAMNNHYRISIEKSPGCPDMPLKTCFDSTIPGSPDNCPLIVHPTQGVSIQPPTP